MSLKTEKSSSLVLHKTLVFFGMKHLWLDQIKDEDEFSIGNIQSFACRHLLLPHTHSPDLTSFKGSWEIFLELIRGSQLLGIELNFVA